MRVNKEALHGADCRIPCAEGTLRFTRKAGFLYVVDLEKPLAPTIISGVTPVSRSAITMLGSADTLPWHQEGNNVVSDDLPHPSPGDYVWVFQIRVSEGAVESRRNVDDRG
jgi:hypothetical protein